ncbi:MAG: hypothetical protein Q8R83_06090 [Legionellaceae bacterium]|nr:hypothetical protein [Legionellaceae bacterium]
MIKVQANYSQKDIERDLKDWYDKAWKITLVEFRKIALEAVTEARNKEANDSYREAINSLANARGVARAIIGPETPGFNDQTANLRASIGFIIMYDGKQVEQDFQGGGGSTVGKTFAGKIAKDYPKGWAIIIVAGMEYSSWVEALGYDVITGSTLGVNLKVDQALKNVEKAMKSYKSLKRK